MSYAIWVILAVALGIIEMFTAGVLALWFAIGALFTAILVACFPELSSASQFITFAFVSCFLFLTTRKTFKKKFEKGTSQPVYSILGKTALVTKEINSIKGTGQININGDIWSAKSNDLELVIPENTKVEVLEIDGVKAVVKVIDTPTSTTTTL
jgi:membrane protein implicated in regulation of membrane protease activity